MTTCFDVPNNVINQLPVILSISGASDRPTFLFLQIRYPTIHQYAGDYYPDWHP